MTSANSILSLNEESEMRRKHQFLTWAFILLGFVFVGIGISVLSSSLPAYSIILVTILWIAIDFMRTSIGSKIYRANAYRKAQEHKAQSDSSQC